MCDETGVLPHFPELAPSVRRERCGGGTPGSTRSAAYLEESTQANVTVLRDGVPQVLVIDTTQLQNLQENRE